MKSASIVRKARFLRSSILEFSTDFSDEYIFEDMQSFKLKKGKVAIFSAKSANEPLYKMNAVERRGSFWVKYPFTIIISGSIEITVSKPTGSWLSKEWSILIENKELAVIKQDISYIPLRENYSIIINDEGEQKIDLMLFAFMYMFDELTSFVGT